ncbi:MAG: 4-hydroxy-tetrahydrodipicolinate reductase [Bacteroidetes bacterium]|nr:4-hydroxy-tetrahydrodipicolinate reductase [Bacteroidota bacterium]
MKIALIGYGKMGKAIEEVAISRGHEITHRISSSNPIHTIDLSDSDVAIEFTKPDLAIEHIHHCINKEIPIIVGTTAWQEKLAEVCEFVNSNNGALLHASNFSIGVNIFFELNKTLARLMSNHPEYKIEAEEIHHVQKLDAPSGTAVSLLNDILNENINYSDWQLVSDFNEANTNKIPVIAKREPDVPGTHEIIYSSEIDTITIKHVAHNRKGFALGAVLAAEFLYGKCGVFTMSDVLKI